LYRLTEASAFFVIRAKSNLACKRLYSAAVNRNSGVICDQTILLTGPNSARYYTEKLRRVKIRDLETGKVIVLLSNNFKLPAATIAQLYRCRWQTELFFKWVK
jgi:IS4 transposase